MNPEDINIGGLLKRAEKQKIKEVILATDPNTDGQATALYIAWMRFLLNGSWDKVVQVKLTQELRRELELIPKDYISHRVGEALLSYSFIETVEALETGRT